MSGPRRAALAAAGMAVAAAGPFLRRRRRRRLLRGEGRVFILEYHDVCAAPEDAAAEGVVGAARLGRQLRHLARQHRFVTLSEAAAALARPGGLGEDLVAVTFDDGYAGNFEAAWPVLREAGVPAAVFVTTGFLDGSGLWFDLARRALAAALRLGPDLAERPRRALAAAFGSWPRGAAGATGRRTGWKRGGQSRTGQPRAGDRARVEAAVEWLKRLAPAARQRLLEELAASDLPLGPAARPLTWDQVRTLAAAGIEIGCHTVSHEILAQLPPGRQAAEIAVAQDRIRAETGAAPALFAYPNGAAGDFDTATRALLRAAGFTAACTTVRGANRPGCDLLQLRRIGVGRDPGRVLDARLSGLLDRGARGRLAAAAPPAAAGPRGDGPDA